MAVVKPTAPLLNRSASLAKGLVFDAALSEGSGFKTLDLVSNTPGTLSSGAVWGTGMPGKGVSFGTSTADKCSFTTQSPVNSLITQSVQIIFQSPFTGYVDGDTLFNKGQEGGGATQRYLEIGEYSSGLGAFVIVSAHASQNGVWTYSPASTGAVHNTIVTYDNAQFTTPTVYTDGIQQGVSTILAAVGNVNPDSTDLSIGNKYTGSNSWGANIFAVRVWNRILTPTEVWAMTVNPWQIYQQPKFRSVNSAASAVVYNNMRMMMGMGM